MSLLLASAVTWLLPLAVLLLVRLWAVLPRRSRWAADLTANRHAAPGSRGGRDLHARTSLLVVLGSGGFLPCASSTQLLHVMHPCSFFFLPLGGPAALLMLPTL